MFDRAGGRSLAFPPMLRTRAILALSLLALGGCDDTAKEEGGVTSFDPGGGGNAIRDAGTVVRPPRPDPNDPPPQPDQGMPSPDAAPPEPDLGMEPPPNCTPMVEDCNGRDDDCDGAVDEDFELGMTCSTEVGGCRVDGVLACDASGVHCEAEAPPVAEEVCDGIDNDCDDQVDEGFGGQTCCSEDFHCNPSDRCDAGSCVPREGGPGPGPGPNPGNGPHCNNPQEMAAFGVYQGNTQDGQSSGQGSCGGFINAEVVFTFEFAEAQPVRLDTSLSLADTVIYVRTDCANEASEVACNDDGGVLFDSEVEFQAAANTRYYVFVDGGILGGGAFTLTFAAGPPPPEPDCVEDADCAGALLCREGACVAPPSCEGAIALDGLGQVMVNTDGLGSDENASCGNASGPEQIYVFETPDRLPIIMDTVGSGFDTILSVRSECGDQASELACNDDAQGTRSRVSFVAEPATPYYVLVDGFNNRSGDAVLNVGIDGSQRDLIPVEACAGPEECRTGACVHALCHAHLPAWCAEGPVIGVGQHNAVSAGEDRSQPSCVGSSTSPEAVFLFAVEAAGRYVADTNGTGFDTVLAVKDGCGDEVACDDDGGEGNRSRVVFDAEPGRLYAITVDGYRAQAGDIVLNLAAE